MNFHEDPFFGREFCEVFRRGRVHCHSQHWGCLIESSQYGQTGMSALWGFRDRDTIGNRRKQFSTQTQHFEWTSPNLLTLVQSPFEMSGSGGKSFPTVPLSHRETARLGRMARRCWRTGRRTDEWHPPSFRLEVDFEIPEAPALYTPRGRK